LNRVAIGRLGLALLASSPNLARGAPPRSVPVEHIELDELDEQADVEEKVVLDEDEPSPKVAPRKEPRRDGLRVKRPKTAVRESKHVWLSIGFLQDATLLSGSEVCSPTSQIDGRFTCIRGSGSQYHGTPQSGFAGKVNGAAFAATRVAASVALPVMGAFGIGARLAYAIAGQGPKPDGGKSFLPVHLELQAQYWLTGDAFSTETIGAFLIASGGISQVDGKTSVTVREDTAVPPPIDQLDNPAVQRLDAYHKSGSGFAGAGMGLFVPVSGGFGIGADLRASMLFPSSGVALGLGLNAAFGL
jgi:hypothetical protein